MNVVCVTSYWTLYNVGHVTSRVCSKRGFEIRTSVYRCNLVFHNTKQKNKFAFISTSSMNYLSPTTSSRPTNAGYTWSSET